MPCTPAVPISRLYFSEHSQSHSCGSPLLLQSVWPSRRWPAAALLGRPRATAAAAAAAAVPFPSPTPLMCKFCGQMFSDASNRFRHEKRHKHPEEVHVCFVCKRPFSRKDNMKKHIKTVHGVSADAEEPGGGLGSHGNGWPTLQAVDMTGR